MGRYDSIRHMPVVGAARECGLILMLRSYIDETEQPDDPAIYGVGSILMTSDACEEFEVSWRKRLDIDGLKVFHAVDLAHSTGEFTKWKRDEARRRALSSDLMAIVSKAIPHRTPRERPTEPPGVRGLLYSSAIAGYVWQLLTKRQRAVFPAHVHPYWPCLYDAFVVAADVARSMNTTVEVVVEENKRFAPEVARAYNNIKANIDHPELWISGRSRGKLADCFSDLTIVSKTSVDKKALPLQAADWLAYEVGNELQEDTRQEGRRKPRWPIEQFKKLPGYIQFYDTPQKFLRKMPPDLRFDRDD